MGITITALINTLTHNSPKILSWLRRGSRLSFGNLKTWPVVNVIFLSFLISACNNEGDTYIASQDDENTARVSDVNTAPVAEPDTGLVTGSLTPVNIIVLNNDTDEHNDVLKVISTTDVAGGTTHINLDDSITFTPNHPFDGVASFTYTIEDTAGLRATASVEITVSDASATEVSINSFTTSDAIISIGQSVNLTWATTNATNCSMSSNVGIDGATGGVIAVSPLSYTIYVLSCDGPAGPVTAQVAVLPIVEQVINTAPVALADTGLSTGSLTPITIAVLDNDSDQDNDALTVISTSNLSGGQANINLDGSITFTPNHPSAGMASFTYTIADSAGLRATAAVEITVSDASATEVSINSFTTSDAIIPIGQSVNLTWASTNATSCTMNNNVDVNGAASGAVSVSPLSYTVYELSCDGPAGPVTAQVEVLPDVDEDADGLVTALETMLGTSAIDSDSDDDGLLDGEEDRNRNGVLDAGETSPTMADTDGDGLLDGIEDKNANGVVDAGETDPMDDDSDNDGLLDGLEDINANNVVDAGETDPLNNDSDDDGLLDGAEDRNSDRLVDNDETDPLNNDSDSDGLLDGIEDGNANGVVDAGETDPLDNDSDNDSLLDGFEDSNGDGIVDANETSPLNDDTDEDGLKDNDEDANANHVVDSGETDPLNNDSDNDGLLDGIEDSNANGVVDANETDPLDNDSDDDSLLDGFEDINGNGIVDANETSPINNDSDDDGLTDGEEDINANHVVDSGETDPLNNDSDDDGLLDGLEDANSNGVVDDGETDPLNNDSDSDGLLDGIEDANANGIVDAGESDALDDDSDNDGLKDGIEDPNANGIVDAGETDPLDNDSDGDSLLDGAEDSNGNGVVDGGETSPIDDDTDNDGLLDNQEDANANGVVDSGETDPLNNDSDGDGLLDGEEDQNLNAVVDAGETNPLDDDSDNDGLLDGIEDANNNGVVDTGETDPLDDDSDNDTLLDGFEDVNGDGVLDAGETSPIDNDSDDDSLLDGEEDANANHIVDNGETDPTDPDTDNNGVCDYTRQDNDEDGIDPVNSCMDPAVLVDINNVSAVEDGKTWSSAFTVIQDAVDYLENSGEDLEIWVAKGTYKAAAENGYVLEMIDGLVVRGGFNGDEVSITQRPNFSMTILSGDFDGDGAWSSDDSERVVKGAEGDTLLENFIVIGGNDRSGQNGGGFNFTTPLVTSPGKLSLNNIIFMDNKSLGLGGAVYIDGIEADLSQTLLYGNESLRGGLYVVATDDFAIQKSTFVNNSAIFYGGAMFLNISSIAPSIQSYVKVNEVSFVGNSASRGAGLYSSSATTDMHLTSSSFTANTTSQAGSAMYNTSSAIDVQSSSFNANTSASGADIFGENTFINTALWETDMSTDASGENTYNYLCSEQDLVTDVSATNSSMLAANPFEQPNASAQVYLNPGAADLSCVDGGDNTLADTLIGSGVWETYSSRSDGQSQSDIDGVGFEISDLGRLYHSQAVVINTFTIDSTTVSWTTSNADMCVVHNSADQSFTFVDASDLASGSLLHSEAAAVKFALICYGENSEPSVADGLVE